MKMFFGCLVALLLLTGCVDDKPTPTAKAPPAAKAAVLEQNEAPSTFVNPNTARTGVSVERDPGGFTANYIRDAKYAAEHKLQVAIRGRCESACIIRLASGENLCIDPKADFGVHEARMSGSRTTASYSGRRAENVMQQVKEMIPACAANLFEEKGGFDSGRMTRFSGREVLQACPQIKQCPN